MSTMNTDYHLHDYNYETKSILLTPDVNTDKDTTEISTQTIAVA